MKDFTKLRLKHSIPKEQLIYKIYDLVKEYNLTYLSAIEITVNAIRIGDFQTLGQASKCRENLISELEKRLQDKIFIDQLGNEDINKYKTRESLWDNTDFRNNLAEYAGIVIAEDKNKLLSKSQNCPGRIFPVYIADFWKDDHGHQQHFLLRFAWLDLENHIYEPKINTQNLKDGLINAYNQFTKTGTENTNDPKPNLEGTYY